MKLIATIIIFISSFALAQNAKITDYMNGQKCECDSIQRLFYDSGEFWKEVPWENGRIDGKVFEYGKDGSLINSANEIDTLYYKTNKVSNALIYFPFMVGYYSATESAGFELGVGYSSGITLSDAIGYTTFGTFIYSSSCVDDGYDQNGIDVDDYNMKGDKGFSDCYDGIGFGGRIGVTKHIDESQFLIYTGFVFMRVVPSTQNDDSILGYYTGKSNKSNRSEFSIPIGIIYHFNNYIGLGLEARTDISVSAIVSMGFGV